MCGLLPSFVVVPRLHFPLARSLSFFPSGVRLPRESVQHLPRRRCPAGLAIIQAAVRELRARQIAHEGHGRGVATVVHNQHQHGQNIRHEV